MKKTIIISLIALGLPLSVFAINETVNRNVGAGYITPQHFTDAMKASYFIASSTATSTFPIASSTTFCLGGTCNSIWPSGTLSGGTTNSLAYWTGANTVGATSSPVVGYITATSTTATSTFGNIDLRNGSTLNYNGSPVIDSSGNILISYLEGPIGVSTSTPATALDIYGDLTVEGLISAPCIATDSTGKLISTTCGLSTAGVNSLLVASTTIPKGTPTNGNVFMGNGSAWVSVATSSLGITGSGSLAGGSTNALTYWTSVSTVGATTSPVVDSITATSTTATSTFPIASSTKICLGGVCNTAWPSGSGGLSSTTPWTTNSLAYITSTGALAGTSSPVVTSVTTSGDIYMAKGTALRINNAIMAWASTTALNYFGGGAGTVNVTGIENTAFGSNAGLNLTTGNDNVTLGYIAGANLTTGSKNMAIGSQAMYNATSSYNNVSIGQDSMYGSGAGSKEYHDNTAIGGYRTMFAIGTGSYNTAIGGGALGALKSGNFNIGIGFYALPTITTPGKNIGIGYNVGSKLLSGASNTFIGSDSDTTDAASTTLTYSVAIGQSAIVGCSNCMVLGGTGTYAVKVGISTTTPATDLDISGLMRAQVAASTTVACTAAIKGAMEYSQADDHFYGCKAAGWVQLDN